MRSIEPHTLDELLRAGDEAWESYRAQAGGSYHHFVPSDHRGAYEELRGIGAGVDTFLELGSAVGVVTILADLLGFQAYGIEIEGELVDRAADIARRFGSRASFAEGTFVPRASLDRIEHLSADFLTPTEGADAFEELGMGFDDFDLIYAYPWPGEEDWLFELVEEHARTGCRLLTYHPDGGFQSRIVGS